MDIPAAHLEARRDWAAAILAERQVVIRDWAKRQVVHQDSVVLREVAGFRGCRVQCLG